MASGPNDQLLAVVAIVMNCRDSAAASAAVAEYSLGARRVSAGRAGDVATYRDSAGIRSYLALRRDGSRVSAIAMSVERPTQASMAQFTRLTALLR
jgi:hypothetical protein